MGGGSQWYNPPAPLALIDTTAPGRHHLWLQMVIHALISVQVQKQPASMFSFLYIRSLRKGSGVLRGMLLVQLVKLVKTAAAKWIRVAISPCQL